MEKTMAVSTEFLRQTKMKLHLLLTAKEDRSASEEALLKALGEDDDVLQSIKEMGVAWALLSEPLPASVSEVFNQA